MDQKSLEKNLANMERELLALQTAHDIGLGAVDYYEYTIPVELSYTGTMYRAFILINIKDGEGTFPFMQEWRKLPTATYSPYTVDFGILNNSSGDKFLLALISFYQETANELITSSSQLEYKISYDADEATRWIS